MAAQVLDEFVVKLGFDVAALSKGQAETDKKLDGLEKRATKTRKSVQDDGKLMGETFDAVKGRLFALTSAFIGFNALKNATVEITKADTALGRFSRNLNIAPERLKAFQAIASKYGSSAEDISGAFSHIADVMATKKMSGTVDQGLLYGMGQAHIDYTKFFDTAINDIDRFKMVQEGLNRAVDEGRMSRTDALNMGAKMGFTEQQVTFMLETKGKLDELTEAQTRLNKVTGADITQAQIRTDAWNNLTNMAEHYHRVVLNGVTEVMSAEARAAREKEGQTPWSMGRVGWSYLDTLVHGGVVVGASKWLLDEQERLAGTGPKQVSTGTITRPTAPTADTTTHEGRMQHLSNLEKQHGLPPRMLQGLYGEESSFGKNLTSPAGAQGPFQFMPRTYARMGGKNINDFDESSGVTARALRDLLDQFGGDPTRALAGYNSAPSKVNARVATGTLPRETQGYVADITRYMGSGNPSDLHRGAGGGTTTVTNTTTNHINAGNADARELAGLLENRFTANADALAMNH